MHGFVILSMTENVYTIFWYIQSQYGGVLCIIIVNSGFVVMAKYNLVKKKQKMKKLQQQNKNSHSAHTHTIGILREFLSKSLTTVV